MGTSATPDTARTTQPPGTEPQRGGGGQPADQSGGGGRVTDGPDTQKGKTGGGSVELPPQWDRSKLNPLLQDMEPEQINDLFLALLRGGQGEGRREEPQARQEEPEQVDYKALMDPQSEHYDPEKALRVFAERTYGPLIKQVSERSMTGVFANMRNVAPDWDEFEQEVRQRLSQVDPTKLSEQLVFGTYLSAKGYRQYMEERKRAGTQRGGTTMPPVTPRSEDAPVDEPLTEKESEVAKIMFPGAQDYKEKFLAAKKKYASGGGEVQVPTGEGKKA